MKTPKTYVDLAKYIRTEAAAMLDRNKKDTRGKPWHHVYRQVEFCPCDANGERIDEVLFEDVSGLSGKKIIEGIKSAVNYYPEATQVSVSVGIDTYDSLYEMMQGGEYEPGRDWWSYDIPQELVTPFKGEV